MANAVRLLVGFLLLFSQPVIAQNMGGGGINNGSTSSTGGTGTVTDVTLSTTGGAANTGTCTSTTIFNCTVATQELFNVQTGAGYQIAPTDVGKIVTVSNAGAQNITLVPTSFVAGNYLDVVNIGTGTWTLVGSGATVTGVTTLATNQSTHLAFDGTNWTSAGGASAGSVTATSTTTFTNKTLTSSTNSLGGVTATFGSDAKGDIYTNGGSSNVITRLGIGSTGNCLVVASGLPSWGSCGGGLTIGTTTITSGATTNIEYNNAGVLGEYTTTGSGTVVAMANSPALTGSATAVGLVVSGASGFTSTTTLVPAAGTLGLAGTSTAPTFGANAEGALYLSSSAGLVIQAQGSSSDIEFLAHGGTSNCTMSSGASLTCSGTITAATTGVGFMNFPSNNGTVSEVFGNTSAGASAQLQVQFKNANATAIQGSITLLGSGNSGGNGANSLTLDGVTSLFLQGGNINAIGINSSALVTLPAITTDAALTDTTVCQDTTVHGLHAGSGTAGICLGSVSSIRFKPDFKLISDGLSVIKNLDPGLYHYAPGISDDNGTQLRVGYTAERYAAIDDLRPFTRFDGEGKPNGTDMMASLPFAVRAIQQLSARVEDLERRVH